MVLVAWEHRKLSPESVTAALRSLLAGDREAARAAGDGVPAAAGGGQGAGRGPVLHGLPVLPAQGRLPAAQLMPPQALAAPGRLLVAPDSPAQAAATWVPGWFADGFAAGLLSQRPSVLSGKPQGPSAWSQRAAVNRAARPTAAGLPSCRHPSSLLCATHINYFSKCTDWGKSLSWFLSHLQRGEKT